MSNFVNGLPPETSTSIYERVCIFYGLVARKAEETDIYTVFKLDILSNHLFPLASNSQSLVKCAAMKALTVFPAPDVYPLLSDPASFVNSITEAYAADPLTLSGSCSLLSMLIMHEITHMRRAVFKGLASAAGVSKVSSEEADRDVENLKRYIKSHVKHLREKWEGGRASSGVRSGLAGMFQLNQNMLVYRGTKFSPSCIFT
jgi:hypothetical protein